MNALDEQVGGSHYKDFEIQPVEFIHRNGIDFLSGNVIKYLCRWKSKGGLNDLEKAKHYIDLLIELSTDKGECYCTMCTPNFIKCCHCVDKEIGFSSCSGVPYYHVHECQCECHKEAKDA